MPQSDLKVTCPYCGQDAILMDSARVYNGRSYGMIWCCVKCWAWVGVHKNSNPPHKPLGRLANAALRSWKIQAHNAFNPLWEDAIKKTKCARNYARNGCYKWLAKQMGIAVEHCHIGMFDVDECKKVIEICSRPVTLEEIFGRYPHSSRLC